MIQKIKDWLWMRSPQELPLYAQQLPPILDRIFRVTGLPDHPGYRARMAQTFMAIPDNGIKIRPKTIALALHRAMSNQTVFNYIQELKKIEDDAKNQGKSKDNKPDVPHDQKPSGA